MKLTLLLILAFCLQVNARSYSQKVTLSLKNASLKSLFQEITKQTGYNFLYTNEAVGKAESISIDCKSMPMESLLQKCLANTHLSYLIVEKTIVIEDKETLASRLNKQDLPAPPPVVIKGRVTDESGKPLARVSILIKGSKAGTNTNENGEFSLELKNEDAVLIFSYIGYESREVNVQGKSSIDIVLKEVATQQQDVVVIGYGTARKKDVTGAVSTVTSKNFNKGVISSPDQLLQSKVAGVEVTNSSGQPGAATVVKIRGNSSIRASNNPLYVVDGVPLDGRSARPSYTGIGSTPDVNPLLYINPSDIAQIDVLKDASACAIYGSRGANGVIIITTKTGTAGPTKLEAGVSWGVNAGLMKKYDILSGSEFRDALKKYNNTAADSGANVNGLKAIANKNVSQNYTVALSGGNENGKYRASFIASSNQGYIKNSNLDKYIGNFSGQYNFFDKRLKLEFDLIAGSIRENIVPIVNNAGAEGSLLGAALEWNPTMNFTDKDGNYVYPASNIGNPLAWLDAYHDRAKVNTFLGHISASLKLAKGLEYKFLYAINNSVGNRLVNVYGFLVGPKNIQGLGTASILSAELTSQNFTHTLTYNAEITKKLNVNAVLGYDYWNSNYSNYNTSASGFNTNLNQHFIVGPYTNYIQNANKVTPPTSSVEPQTEIQSVFARATFDYDSRYYLTGTLRCDGSSKFGSDNHYGYFPALAAKWSIHNEDFMKDNHSFSNLALRASWGITGNQEFPAGASQEQYSFSGFNSISQTNLYNKDLKWEQTESVDVGIDVASKSNRVWGSFDYFRRNTTNVLYQAIAIQPGPASYGFINLPAHITNNGFELAIGASLINKKDIGLEVNANYAYVRNMVRHFQQNGLDLTQYTSPLQGPGFTGQPLIQLITNNQPVDVFYLHQFQGYDDKGNQKVGDSLTYAGDPNPRNLFGISFNFRYKKFTLDMNFGGASGYYIYNNTANANTTIANISNGNNIDRRVYKSPQSASDNVPTPSTRYLEKGDYIKLRNTAITYHIGDTKFIKNLNAFVSASNLFVITKYSGFDPEVNTDASSQGFPSRSMEYLSYPTARTIQAGFSFSL